jgi:outer membrane receptor protein involved in Fe transport
MRELGFFAQDSWRWKSNVTVTAGLRYEVQRPFYALNNSYSTATVDDVWGVSGVGNLFKPGVLTGRKPTFTSFEKDTKAYKTDWNNFAPSLGLTWSLGQHGGPFGKLLQWSAGFAGW